jgi:hypothetical protein
MLENTKESFRQKIRTERKRTGLSLPALMKGDDVPEGLTLPMVQNFLAGKGSNLTPKNIDYILSRYAALPTREQRGRERRKNYVDITEEIKFELQGHIKRTGVNTVRILYHVKDKPGKLSSMTIAGWVSGRTKSADKDKLELVLNAWRDL